MSESSKPSADQFVQLGPVPDFELPDWSGKDRTPPPMTLDQLYAMSVARHPKPEWKPPLPEFIL